MEKRISKVVLAVGGCAGTEVECPETGGHSVGVRTEARLALLAYMKREARRKRGSRAISAQRLYHSMSRGRHEGFRAGEGDICGVY